MLRFAQALLLTAVAAAVLLFGGAEPISFAAVQVLLLGGAALLLVRDWPGVAPAPARMLWAPAILLGWVLLQMAPLPAGVFTFLRGMPAESGTGALTFDLHETRTQFLILLACLAGFYLSLRIARSEGGARVLVYGLVAIGLFEAFYGLVQYLTGWQYIFFYQKTINLFEATGTYINRNHYAGLLEMLLPLCLAVALPHLDRLRRHHPGDPRGAISDPAALRVLLWVFLAAVIFLALVFSRSRMGILAATLSLLVMIVLLNVSARSTWRAAAIAAVALTAGMVMVAWVGPGPVIERFEKLELEYTAPDSRLSMWQDTSQLIARHPLLGTGYGAFPVVFTTVQSRFLNYFVNSAHNDYLEFTAELGVPLALLLFGAVAWVLLRSIRYLWSREPRGFDYALALAATGSITALLLHSLADFNLRIPGNALVFAVILGLACSLRLRRPQPPAEELADSMEEPGEPVAADSGAVRSGMVNANMVNANVVCK